MVNWSKEQEGNRRGEHALSKEKETKTKEPAKKPQGEASSPEYAGPQPGNAFGTVAKFFIAVVAVFAAVWLLRTFVFAPYEIPSGSMEDTIKVEDYVFAEKVSYNFRSPEPGEIITFKDPLSPDRTLIKRVIATGGQTVDLIDGKVVVDGKPLEEPYVKSGAKSYPLTPDKSVQIEYPYTVPEGYIWVMGDNRTQSSDSRVFGAIPVSNVVGHAIFRYWPADRIGGIS